MQIYFHSRLWSYLPRVPILVEDTVYTVYIYIYLYSRDTIKSLKAIIIYPLKLG